MFGGSVVPLRSAQLNGTHSRSSKFILKSFSDAFCTSPELEVFFWKYNDFLRRNEPGPPVLITPDLIKSQAARATVLTRPPRLSDEDEDEHDARHLWVTIGLSRVCIILMDFV